MPFDLLAARAHARLWFLMSSSGQTIGNFDLVTAATAVAKGYGVLTRNQRDFMKVPGLQVVSPAK